MAIFTLPSIRNNKFSDKEKQDHVDDFEKDTGIEIIDSDVNSLSELEDEYDDLNQMTYKQRKVSNAKSVQIYGLGNQERYDKMKARLLRGNINKDNAIKVTAESNVIVKNDEPMSPNKLMIDANIELAILWAEKANITIITPQNSCNELEMLWNKWNLMHKKLRRTSDAKSVELFGKTNSENYQQLKSFYLRTNQAVDTTIENIDKAFTTSNSYKPLEDKLNNDNIDLFTKTRLLSELQEMKNGVSILEAKAIDTIVNNNIELMLNNVSDVFNNVNDLPFFLPDDMISMGIFGSDNFFDIQADNRYLDIDNTILTETWFKEYRLFINGFKSEAMYEYTSLWINKLNELYCDYDNLKKNGSTNMINARKQSILELGWNPEVPFSLSNRKLCTEMNVIKLKSMNDKKVIDVQELYNMSEPDEDILFESDNVKEGKAPLFVVLSYNNLLGSRAIRSITHSNYSHSALSLDIDLKRLYSYNSDVGGFALESLEKYKKQSKDSGIAVFATFLPKKQILKIKSKLDYYIANKRDTSYSFLNIIGMGFGKDVESNTSMICSQFVDKMLKMVNMDITKKPSGLVTPHDVYVNSKNSLYKIYEGNISNYDMRKTNRVVKELQNKSKGSINEATSNNEVLNSYLDIYYINEAKEFPVQFDEEGNLLIKNMKRIDFESEYAQSHKLLLIYDKNDNMEAMKYELSKLWFFNTVIEKKIYSEKHMNHTKQELFKVRARILNDFNKYLTVVVNHDKNFNFADYYNMTPFSDSTIKINSTTLKKVSEFIKTIPILL